jgi:hypothetical protein
MTDYTNQAPPRREFQDASDGGTKGIGEALSDVTRDLSVLVQQELALAKAEVSQTVNRVSQAAGMFAGAAVAAFLFVVFLSLALWVAISDRTGPGWGAVIVAVIWLVAGVVLYFVARAQLKKVSGMPQTAETVSQVPNALKGHEERNQ